MTGRVSLAIPTSAACRASYCATQTNIKPGKNSSPGYIDYRKKRGKDEFKEAKKGGKKA
jgi:hypothetical protein